MNLQYSAVIYQELMYKNKQWGMQGMAISNVGVA